MNYLNNIKSDKLTTGAGVAVLLVIISNSLGYNISEQLGMDNTTLILSIGASISALFNLISTRTPQGTNNKKDEKSSS